MDFVVLFSFVERPIEDQLTLLPKHQESSVEIARARPVHRWRLVFLAHRKTGLIAFKAQSLCKKLVALLAA